MIDHFHDLTDAELLDTLDAAGVTLHDLEHRNYQTHTLLTAIAWTRARRRNPDLTLDQYAATRTRTDILNELEITDADLDQP